MAETTKHYKDIPGFTLEQVSLENVHAIRARPDRVADAADAILDYTYDHDAVVYCTTLDPSLGCETGDVMVNSAVMAVTGERETVVIRASVVLRLLKLVAPDAFRHECGCKRRLTMSSETTDYGEKGKP